ncbi:MAG: hypothetical protein LBJ41_05580 [Treponema sp.]|jgi:hypothetical protein|nr:hypothetical protein [Treponema sp.]
MNSNTFSTAIRSIAVPATVLALFWTKVAVRRVIALVKLSPIVVIGGTVFIVAFVYTKTDVAISLNIEHFIIIMALLFFAGLIYSFKSINIPDKLIRYSKSAFSNHALQRFFFIQRAIANNVYTLVFMALVFLKWINPDFPLNPAILPALFLLFTVCSFGVLVMRHRDMQRTARAVTWPRRVNINAAIKSTVLDFMTPSFLLLALISVTLFVVVFIDYMSDTHIEAHLLFAIFLGISALGFTSISDALTGVNWAFYAVINRAFTYQFKRAALFLVAVFAPMIIISAAVNANYLFVYLYAEALLITFFISAGFLNIPAPVSVFLISGFTAITLYISYINPYLTLIMAMPATLLLIKARSDYYDNL